MSKNKYNETDFLQGTGWNTNLLLVCMNVKEVVVVTINKCTRMLMRQH